jgi:hypothetical protein
MATTMTTLTDEKLSDRLDDFRVLLELFISRYPYHPFSQHFRAALALPAVSGKMCAFPNCDCASECDGFRAAAAAQR